MRFEQTKEILEHIGNFHASTAACYRALEDRAKQTRVKLFLDYLSQRQSELAAAVDDFLAEAPADVLDTWFQFADEDEYLTLACPDAAPHPDMSEEEVMAVAHEVHECLMGAYRAIAANSESQAVREVFENLLQGGEGQWKALMRNVQLLADL
jgi:hypothetical protein